MAVPSPSLLAAGVWPPVPGGGSPSPSPSPTSLAPPDANDPDLGSGSGSALPFALLLCCTLSALVASAISVAGIWMQLRNYRMPALQRFTVRIMLMVPIYAIASLISLFSLDAAFWIDAIRDLYEAFVIYCFFQLLVSYLGGERSLIILLHGRPPTPHVFPVTLFSREMDVSDPYTFLFLKRGILQYAWVKPLLALATLVLKLTGTYNEGALRADSGYTYVQIVYNISICTALYCLAMFWIAVHPDLKPFRPMPKFLCVKGVLFATFWQGLFISFLVAVGAIPQIGPYKDAEHVSLALGDVLICFEMPLFAIAHWYAFSHTDYIDKKAQYAGRMPVYYAIRDAFGMRDVLHDSRTTLEGTGFSYQTFEPAEGGLHQGKGRERRVRAGLRYAKGGKRKYWIPLPGEEAPDGRQRGPSNPISRLLAGRREERAGYAPLLPEQAAEVVHDEHEHEEWGGSDGSYEDDGEEGGDGSLVFEDLQGDEEALYQEAKRLPFGDYHYPCIDCSREEARRVMREYEDAVLANRRSAATHLVSPPASPGPSRSSSRIARSRSHSATSHLARPSSVRGHPRPPGRGVYGRSGARPEDELEAFLAEDGEAEVVEDKKAASPTSGTASPLQRPDAVDLVCEDPEAEEAEAARVRRRGDPNVLGGNRARVYRRVYQPGREGEVEDVQVEVEEEDLAGARARRKREIEGREVREVEEVQVAREGTPPPSVEVRVDVKSPGDEEAGGGGHAGWGEEDNPWR